MHETGFTYRVYTPSEGSESSKSIAPVSRSARPGPTKGAREAKPLGFFGVSFVIVSFGIAIGAATIGMQELLDRRHVKGATAASAAPSPAPPAAHPLPAPDHAPDPAAVIPAAADSATTATPTKSGAAPASSAATRRRFHSRRIGPPRPPGHGSLEPPPNPYEDHSADLQ